MAALLCTVGCGRLDFDRSTDARTAPSDSTGDATRDAACVLGPFGAPQLIANINAIGATLDDWSPAVTPDDLSIYFYTFRGPLPPAPDVWRAHRTDPTLPFPAPTLISDVSSAKSDIAPHVTADELTIVFASDRTGTLGLLDLFEATRASTAVPFGTAVDLTPLNSAADEDTLWLSPDGLHIVFSSKRGASVDLFTSERASRTAAFSAPVLLPAVSTESSDDRAPWLTTDRLEIYFSSSRPGMGGYDIWRATRTSPTAAFGPAVNVSELNSPQDDYTPSLSGDGLRLYYNYNAKLFGGGDANMYVSERSCL